MSSKQESTAGADATATARRRGGGRRLNTHRAPAAKRRVGEEPAAAETPESTTAAMTPKATAATTPVIEKPTKMTRGIPAAAAITTTASATTAPSRKVEQTRPQRLEPTPRPHRQPATEAEKPHKPEQEPTVPEHEAVITTTTAPRSTKDAAAAAAAHVLNASSPAFVPRQYRDHTTQSYLMQSENTMGTTTMRPEALAFSLPNSPLMGLGSSTGAPSSVASPLMFVTSVAGQPLTPGASGAAGSGGGRPASQSARQLRDAYARAAAASVTRSTAQSSTSTVVARQERPDPSLRMGGPHAAMHHLFVQPHIVHNTTSNTTASVASVTHTPSVVSARPPVSEAPRVSAVYGPSVPLVHPQFIDVVSGATSSMPFALHANYVDPMGVQEKESEAELAASFDAPSAMDEASVAAAATTRPLPAVYKSAAHTGYRAYPAVPTRSLPLPQPQQKNKLPEKEEPMEEAWEEPEVVQLGLSVPTPSQRRMVAITNTTAATAAVPVVSRNDVTEALETPKRRPGQPTTAATTIATTVTKTNTAAASAAKSTTSIPSTMTTTAAETVEKCEARLFDTEERAADGRGTAAAVMGLTGSTRRGPPTHGHSAAEGEGEAEGEEEAYSAGETPVMVLTSEDSPYVISAPVDAEEEEDTEAAPGPNRRLLVEEDSAIIAVECAAPCSGAQSTSSPASPLQSKQAAYAVASPSSSGNLQRAVLQLMAQIQSNNAKSSTTTASAAAETPQRLSTNTTSFKTPEVQREPSARPSATKSAVCRNITTIIHTPNKGNSTTASITAAPRFTQETSPNTEASAAEHSSGAGRTAAAKPTTRSLASCLEATEARSGSVASSSRMTGTSAIAPSSRTQRRTPRSTVEDAHHYNHYNSGSSTVDNAARSTPTQYAIVIDGHMHRHLTAVSNTPLQPGVCVLFEEDRGIDMGRVAQCAPLEESAATGGLASLASATSPLSRKDRPAPVLRKATAEEEYRWLYADVAEAEATLEPCREAAARLALPVTVVGAVYQFNKAKLTFYYESETRVDFRPLLPTLFSRFHCRIWMSRVSAPAVEGAEQ